MIKLVAIVLSLFPIRRETWKDCHINTADIRIKRETYYRDIIVINSKKTNTEISTNWNWQDFNLWNKYVSWCHQQFKRMYHKFKKQKVAVTTLQAKHLTFCESAPRPTTTKGWKKRQAEVKNGKINHWQI